MIFINEQDRFMKKDYIILVVLLSLCIGGCGVFSSRKNANEHKMENASKEVDKVKEKLANNSKEKMYAASTMATGTDRALSKITNATVEVKVAKEMNDRVLSILGNPYLDDQNKIKKIVDELTSQVDKVRLQGEKDLAEKDKEIAWLQIQRDNLKNDISQKTKEFNDLALEVATKADVYKETVDKCNSFFGLGAIFYGIKRFFTTCLVFVLITSIIFLALKVFASANPMVGAAFSIFNHAGGLILHFVKGVLPGSFKVAGFKFNEEVAVNNDMLIKTVDVIELMKNNQSILPPDKAYTFNNYLEFIDKKYSDSDKRLYDSIKHDLQW